MATVYLWVCDQPHDLSVSNFNGKCPVPGGHYSQSFATVTQNPFVFDLASLQIIVPAVALVLATAFSIKIFRRVIR
jgi:hypothetical protein